MSSGVAVSRMSAHKPSSASRLKKPLNHPKYTDMIRAAIASLKERGGSSRQAILKYILSHYNIASNEKMANVHLKFALKAGVKSGKIKQAKGSGASGSFKLGEVKAVKKPATKKATKKPSKSKASKSPKKKTAAKSVKKSPKKSTKKPASKKAKSPKKAKKPKISTSRKSPSKSKAKPKARVTKKVKSKSKSKSPKKSKARR